MPSNEKGAASMMRVARKHACDECRIRKIKCDFVTPACLSCVSRGLGERCTYGKRHHSRRREGAYINRARVQGRSVIVEKDEQDPPPLPRRPIDVGAFDVSVKAHVMRRTTRGAADKQMSTLPSSNEPGLSSQMYAVAEICPRSDKIFEALDFYLDRIEPTVALFNEVLLRRHFALFAELICSILSKPLQTVLEVDEDEDKHRSNGSAAFSTSRRGIASLSPPRRRILIAMCLSLIVVVLDHMPVSEVIDRQMVDCDTAEEVILRQTELHEAALSMLQQSDYLQQPSLWTLQAIVLMRLYWFERMLFSHCTVWNLTAIRLAHSMGIDRLGSLLDDLDKEEQQRQHKGGVDGEQVRTVEPKDSEHWLEVMRGWASVWVPRFEQSDLALRELGRRVWCNLVTADCILNSHIDCFFATPALGARVHCMQTKPPWAKISDAEMIQFQQQKYGKGRDQLWERVHQSKKESSYEARLVAAAHFSRQIAERVAGEPFDRSNLERLLALLPDSTSADPLLDEYRRLFLEWSIHSVVLRSGLPGLSSALKPGNDTLFQTCTSSALALVNGRRRMEQTNLPWRKLILARTVLFQAVLVLLAVLLENPVDKTSLDLNLIRKEVDEAMSHLRRDIDGTGKRNPVELPALEALEKLYARAMSSSPRQNSLFEQLEMDDDDIGMTSYEDNVQWLLSLLWQGGVDPMV